MINAMHKEPNTKYIFFIFCPPALIQKVNPRTPNRSARIIGTEYTVAKKARYTMELIAIKTLDNIRYIPNDVFLKYLFKREYIKTKLTGQNSKAQLTTIIHVGKCTPNKSLNGTKKSNAGTIPK